jgi:hypothetical protein
MRSNAQKSTGPKSKAGKAKVALNSLWHGRPAPSCATRACTPASSARP